MTPEKRSFPGARKARFGGVKNICVFCGSSNGRRPAFARAAAGFLWIAARRDQSWAPSVSSISKNQTLGFSFGDESGLSYEDMKERVMAELKKMAAEVKTVGTVETMTETFAKMTEHGIAGIEIRGGKAPHWTGTRNSPRTFGHFGQTGTFIWVDPDRDLALVVLTGRDFDEWAKPLWPAISDEVLREYGPD